MDLLHLMFGTLCQIDGTFTASATIVIVQSPAAVSSYMYIAITRDLSSSK